MTYINGVKTTFYSAEKVYGFLKKHKCDRNFFTGNLLVAVFDLTRKKSEFRYFVYLSRPFSIVFLLQSRTIKTFTNDIRCCFHIKNTSTCT